MGHHMIKSCERERGLGSHDWKKSTGTLQVRVLVGMGKG